MKIELCSYCDYCKRIRQMAVPYTLVDCNLHSFISSCVMSFRKNMIDICHTTVLEAASCRGTVYTFSVTCLKKLGKKHTHKNSNRNGRSMTHCISGHVIYLDALHLNYGWQEFFQKFCHKITNKC